jgi:hypothetical protein
MIKPEQVPDAVVFAMQDCMKDPEASPWDWIAAALNAWPGMSHAHNEEGEIKDWATWYALPWHRAETSNGIILPLTENSNDKG